MKTKQTILCGILAAALMLAFTTCDTGGSSQDHEYSDAWFFNATQHWHECTDDNDNARSDEADHTGDPCTICGYDSTAILVTFSSLTANGSEAARTTMLTLTFSAAITDLSADDILLSGVADVQKRTLSGSGPTYTLGIRGFTAGGSLSVAVAKTGYTISGSPKPVTIRYYSGGGNPGNPGGPGDPGGPTYPDWMVKITAGNFTMGSDNPYQDGTDASPPHNVTLTKYFYLGKHEVTQKEYADVMESLPSYISADTYGKGNNYPVYYVSWYDALVYCNKLSIKEGLTPAYSISGSTDPTAWGTVPTTNSDTTWDAVTVVNGSTGYRLPTEAQWEYACRAGTTTAWHSGATDSNLSDYEWYDYNSNNKSHEVGGKKPNPWGLYDMGGNVYEWCWDWYGPYDDPAQAQTDPTGASSGSNRVFRGGSWEGMYVGARSAYRSSGHSGTPILKSLYVGFRVLRPAP